MTSRPALELLVDGLSFPTSLTFAPDGTAYLAESGLGFAGAPSGGRIWRLEPSGRRELLIEQLLPPVNGLTWHEGALYASGGSPKGSISRVEPDGRTTVVVEDLPGPGNYHTNMVVFGPDRKLYFSQGAMTNSGIIGLDAYQLGWLQQLPHAHDVPGYDVVLTGLNVETANPFGDGPEARTRTGAFVPFGVATEPGQHIPARLPCTAAILRCDPDGSNLELVAWGLRNAFGLGFLPDGRLLAIDQGADDRGSRPIGNAPDALFEIRPGAWYGWPDFVCGIPVTAAVHRPERGPPPRFLLANHQRLPPPEHPLLRFPSHAAPVKFDVAPEGGPLEPGQLAVAVFGDENPMTGPQGPHVGRSVVRVDPRDWSLHPLVNEQLARPIDVRFHPTDGTLLVLDFGEFEIDPMGGVAAKRNSGAVWRLMP